MQLSTHAWVLERGLVAGYPQGWFLDMAKSIFDRTLVKTGNNRQKTGENSAKTYII